MWKVRAHLLIPHLQLFSEAPIVKAPDFDLLLPRVSRHIQQVGGEAILADHDVLAMAFLDQPSLLKAFIQD